MVDIDDTKYPEIAAMVRIVEILEPFDLAKRARVLAAVTLMMCPRALDDRQWLALIHRVQAAAEECLND